MFKDKMSVAIKIINFFLFFFCLVFYCSGTFDISIKNATPFTVLPLLVAFSIFSTPLKSAVVGLICGIFVDSVANKSFSFNALILMLIAFFVCVTANNLFNQNIRAVAVISLLSSIIYFVLNWAVFYAFTSTVSDSTTYFLRYSLPSAIYTAILIFPFFYLYKYFEKIK